MMSNNKILTVSYGTFSCTLEGFDDSFGTMKAIAEYFRDLAADDRYFGAEPPQPDAEMLARIAQKEISRRVEAREHDGKIVLSALEDQSAPAPAAPPETDNTAVLAAATVATAAAASPVAEAPAPVPTPPVEAAPAPAPMAEAPPAAAPETPAAPVEEAAVEEVVEQVTTAEETETPAATDEFVEDENDIVPGQPDADVEAFFAESPAAELENDMLDEDEGTVTPLTLVSSNDAMPAADDAVAEDIDPAPAPQPDSIAAKLERIRAVVARQADADEDDDYLEDEHADIKAEAATDDAATSDAADAPETDAPETATSETEISETDDGDADVITQARADIEDALEADDAATAEDETDTDEDELTAILSRLDGSASAEATEDEPADLDADAPADATDANVSNALDNLFEAEADAKDTDADAPEADAPRARVIKVKRADLEAAIEKGDLEEYEAEAEEEAKADAIPALDDVAPAKTPNSSLSAEEEADLVRELAELEADIKGEEADDASVPEAEDLVAEDVDTTFQEPVTAEVQELEAEAEPETDDATEEEEPAPRSVLPSLDESENSDMNRLMAETDSQMDEPESATRRDAFAHLRAAVAARKADGTMEADDAAKKDANAYRSDLADVVRPRRPEAPTDGARTARPGEGRPAPLKLVAEQRVDIEQPSNAAPVQPRRVSAVADTTPTPADADSFADYASDLGATKLPELLEAAASYMSFVEGREEFSRPQLMTKVRQAGPSGEFSREDGLRSFGQLLRSGKIEKIKGGRFTVSDDIGYRPDERAAG